MNKALDLDKQRPSAGLAAWRARLLRGTKCRQRVATDAGTRQTCDTARRGACFTEAVTAGTHHPRTTRRGLNSAASKAGVALTAQAAMVAGCDLSAGSTWPQEVVVGAP